MRPGGPQDLRTARRRSSWKSTPPIGVHDLRDAVHREDLLHQLLGQNTGFVGMDVDTDEVAGVDADHITYA